LDNLGQNSSEPFSISTLIKSRFFSAPKLWPADERHVRRPGWTELFYDLVFAAAISQLSTPLEADYSLHGVAHYAFLLALIFLAWLGYTNFTTQFAVDDVVQRALIVAQVFLVAVMAANATGPLSSRDAAGFGAAYGGVRAILALQYARVIALPATRSLVIRRIGWLVAAAVVVWIASALLPAPHRYVAWCLAFSMDIANSWPPSRGTIVLPPGAAHFPERFGLLTIILLGEFVASVMRGIESQMGWSFLAASAAVLSLALGFALWSCYSDGATGWETRHMRTNKHVVQLRIWIALHFLLFLGIGVLGVGARHGIALPPGGSFAATEQWLICFAGAGTMVVIMGIAATSERHVSARNSWAWLAQVAIAVLVLGLAPLASRIVATALLLVLFLCFVGQTALLLINQCAHRHIAEI
jgi:low temperature requirement protein LtrA